MQYKLSEATINRQLQTHFNNLFNYFHPRNEHIRVDDDRHIELMHEDILELAKYLVSNPNLDGIYFSRKFNPVHFRLVQLINHYGSGKIHSFLCLTYGEQYMDQKHA